MFCPEDCALLRWLPDPEVVEHGQAYLWEFVAVQTWAPSTVYFGRQERPVETLALAGGRL